MKLIRIALLTLTIMLGYVLVFMPPWATGKEVTILIPDILEESIHDQKLYLLVIYSFWKHPETGITEEFDRRYNIEETIEEQCIDLWQWQTGDDEKHWRTGRLYELNLDTGSLKEIIMPKIKWEMKEVSE